MEKDHRMIYLQLSSGETISYDLYPLHSVLYLRRICSEDFTIAEDRILLFREGYLLDDMDLLHPNEVIMIHFVSYPIRYSNSLQAYKLACS